MVRQFESARWSFSLPTQRCFPPRGFPFRSNRLFSAYAEVFPSVPQRSGRDRSFLCLRRGVSRVQTDLWNLLYFSLPTQRCFCRRIQCRHCRGLFSAYAEVFLSTVSRRRKSLPFLCLRRGVSPCRPSLWESLPLFSAYAEVFLTKQKHSGFIRAFLCLRRGVSAL